MFERIVQFAYQLSMILEMAWEEVGNDDDNHSRRCFLGTEHILLGLVRADDRVAGFLKSFGISLEDLRERVKVNVSQEHTGKLSPSFPFKIGEAFSKYEAWAIFCDIQQGTSRNRDAGSSVLAHLLESDCEAERILSRLCRDMSVDMKAIHEKFRREGLRRSNRHPQLTS